MDYLTYKSEVAHEPLAYTARANPSFCSMRQLGVFLSQTSYLEGIVLHLRVNPQQ